MLCAVIATLMHLLSDELYLEMFYEKNWAKPLVGFVNLVYCRCIPKTSFRFVGDRSGTAVCN